MANDAAVVVVLAVLMLWMMGYGKRGASAGGAAGDEPKGAHGQP